MCKHFSPLSSPRPVAHGVLAIPHRGYHPFRLGTRARAGQGRQSGRCLCGKLAVEDSKMYLYASVLFQ